MTDRNALADKIEACGVMLFDAAQAGSWLSKGNIETIVSALRQEPSSNSPRAWIANDPEDGPYLTWSEQAAKNFPNPIALFAGAPPSPSAGEPVAALEPSETASKLREYTAIKYAAPTDSCKCGKCQLVPPDVLRDAADEIGILVSGFNRLHSQFKQLEAVLAATPPSPAREADLLSRILETYFPASEKQPPLIQEARAALSPRTEGGQAEGYWKVSWREPNKEHNFKILQSKALAFEWAQRISAEHGIIIEHVDEAIEPEAEQ